jgi:hypothetical protein
MSSSELIKVRPSEELTRTKPRASSSMILVGNMLTLVPAPNDSQFHERNGANPDHRASSASTSLANID